MGRKTQYNNITTPELIAQINDDNKYIQHEFVEYLQSIDRAGSTIDQYQSDLNIFFVWNLLNNNNKEFTTISKREFAKFQNYGLNDLGWSPKRIRRVKSVISSLSNFIEDIMDEEEGYEGYKSVIRKIENPANEAVREKTVFEPEELQKLLDYLVEEGQYKKACLVALAMYSGRRKAELPRFKVSYFEDKNVMFGSLYKTDEKVQTKGRGKNGKMLYLYVLKHQFDPYLKLWLDYRKENNINSVWLFPDNNDENKPISTYTLDSWTDSFSKILNKDFYWHSLRHFFTTELSKQNIPDSVIQDIVGWESAEMCKLYNDTTIDDNLGKYFGEDGIKKVKSKGLSDL